MAFVREERVPPVCVAVGLLWREFWLVLFTGFPPLLLGLLGCETLLFGGGVLPFGWLFVGVVRVVRLLICGEFVLPLLSI